MSSDSEKEPIEKKSEEQKPSEDKPAEKPAAAKPAAAKPAAKKEEPELPAFEKGLADKITEKFGEKTTVSYVKPDRIGIKVGRDDIHDVAEFASCLLYTSDAADE